MLVIRLHRCQAWLVLDLTSLQIKMSLLYLWRSLMTYVTLRSLWESVGGSAVLCGPQIAAIVCTVAAGVVCGAVAGWLVTSINLAGHSLSTPQLFDDGAIWEVHPVAIRLMATGSQQRSQYTAVSGNLHVTGSI